MIESLSWEASHSCRAHSCKAIYLSSVGNVATDFCYCLVHDIGPPANIDTWPNIKFQSFSSVARSASKQLQLSNLIGHPEKGWRKGNYS